MARSLIVIGAGMAGLSTGVYAQRNGYDTTIFELHDKPGGVCTAWRRKGYVFEGCVHALAGTGEGSAFRQIWRELGVDFTSHPAVVHDELVRLEDVSGRTLIMYTDPDRLEHHLKELSPGDTRVIEEFTGALRKAARLDIFSAQVGGGAGMLKLLPHLPLVMKWGKLTLAQMADRFQDPFLKRAFRYVQYSMPVIPTVIPLVFLAGMRRGDLGFPRGGALGFGRAIERRFNELGGKVHYGARVVKILTEPAPAGKGADRAVGVRLADGSEYRADVVVSAADGYSTIYGMLDGIYVNEQIDNYYTKRVPKGSQPYGVHVSFGVARRFPAETHALVLFAGTGDGGDARRPVIAGEPRDRLDVEIYAFDPSLAPEGKTAIKVVLESDYDYWRALRDQGEDVYRAEKDRVALAVLEWLGRRFPGIEQDVEVMDVATQLTTERYTGSLRGAQAWGMSDKVSLFSKGFTRTLPGLENFHMVGQWAEATIGISTTAAAGRRMVQELCRKDGRRFEAPGQ